MARKKQELQLQVEVETQEEWEEMLNKEGLSIVDVYQEWCGPCKAMVANFRRLKNELGDDLLHFVVAKADTVDALEYYKGRCEPCFLFFAGGSLVSVIRGANSPLLIKTMTEQLAQEHKVLEGNAERKEVRDPMLAMLKDKNKDDFDDEDEDTEEKEEDVDDEETAAAGSPVPAPKEQRSPTPDEVKKAVTLAILKPDIVEAGKADEIIQKMKEAGIEILEQREHTLTEEEAQEFYAHKKDEEFFDDLVKHMASGPSMVLVLSKGDTGEGIIEEWRELLGPASVEEAREQAPDSLRAQYGRETYVNALHGSDSTDTAMKELAFFFPDYGVPTVTVKTKKPKIQRTVALIRPDALRERKDEILDKIRESGFEVAMQKEVQLTKEQAEDFYKEHREEAYFEELTTRMTNGPMLALLLAREEAVQAWREQLGPKDLEEAQKEAPDSLRAQFAMEGVPINQLHGSNSDSEVDKDMNFFFPMQQTVACIKPDAHQTKEDIMQRIREAGFHIAARKETELTEDMAKQFYQEQEGKDYYDDLVHHMCSGPTLFMVLSRENAVEGWRSLLGPTDPEQAKDTAPDTLRALYGKDIKENAVHGSSDSEQAARNIKVIFGDLDFNPDGGADGLEDDDTGKAGEGDHAQEDESQEAEGGKKDDEEKKEEEETQGRSSETASQKGDEDDGQKKDEDDHGEDDSGEKKEDDAAQEDDKKDGDQEDDAKKKKVPTATLR